MLLFLQHSDLVHSGEFVPGYSSFLFNQLLQTQFYSVNHGGISINLNLSGPLSPPPSIPDVNIPRAVLVGEHITPLSPFHSPAHSGELLPPLQTKNNTQRNEPVNNGNNNNNNNVNNNNTTTSTRYKSTVFQRAIAEQQKIYNRMFDINTRGYVNKYPEIDLLEFFGEREILKRNKRRLQAILYDTRCNIGIIPLFPPCILLRYPLHDPRISPIISATPTTTHCSMPLPHSMSLPLLPLLYSIRTLFRSSSSYVRFINP
jgi:hypothetical protein